MENQPVNKALNNLTVEEALRRECLLIALKANPSPSQLIGLAREVHAYIKPVEKS